MERVIRFRAKVKKTRAEKSICMKPEDGTWVYGDLLIESKIRPCVVDYNSRSITVDCDTICQFTGMNDKNGKEIYEFDVVRNKWGGIGIVVLYNGSLSIKWDEDEIHCLFDELDDDIEVIGNKFDNSELLNEKVS